MKAFIKRTLAVSLCAALLTGAAVSMPALVPDSGITASAYSSGDYEYTVSNNKATITRYYGRSGSVTIPSKIGGYTVTSIGSYAFSYCSSLTSVTIPDSVTSIGYGVFYGCSSLTNVTIPKSVTKIEKMAFGYYTDDNYNSVKIDNFTIYGEEGTAAEEYANDNGFKFVAIEAPINSSVINSDIVQIGDKVRVSASAKGGTGGYKYAYYYKRSSNNTWKTLGTEWGTNSSAAFAPTAEADYDIKVVVKDSAGETAEKLFTVKAVKELELTNVSVVGREKIKLGTAIPMIGKAVGGKGEYRYSFYFKRATNTNWKLLGEKFTDKASARFKPTAAGSYNIRIDVKDSSGKIEKKYFTATVK